MIDQTSVDPSEVVATFNRVAEAFLEQNEYFTELDQVLGDGDLGITTSKIATALVEYTKDAPINDMGKFFVTAGMKVNGAAPSTMGTLLSTALIRAGGEAKGKIDLDSSILAAMLQAANLGIQERGKAKLGDKTIVDAMNPATIAFTRAIDAGESRRTAGGKMLIAAQGGLDAVTPIRSRIGRAGWIGDRTEGQVDPGCAVLVTILKAILDD
jgi:dihydroxyacetone kinase